MHQPSELSHAWVESFSAVIEKLSDRSGHSISHKNLFHKRVELPQNRFVISTDH